MGQQNQTIGLRMRRGALCFGLLFALTTLPVAGMAAEPSKFLALGTGASNGVFYPVGQGICRLLNEHRPEHGVRCLAYSTGAAVYNIQALGTGELDLGITYTNLSSDAFAGRGDFAAYGPMRQLRSVAALYQMPAGILVHRSRDISTLKDPNGLRINIGNSGSGKRTIADAIFKAMNWSVEDFVRTTELSTDEVEKPFCDGEIDVIIEAMATSSDFFERITDKCQGKFVSLPAETIAKILAVAPALVQTRIPGGIFPHNSEDVQTLGINTELVTSARVSAEAIYAVTKSLFADSAAFRHIHPALDQMSREKMVSLGTILPVHEGALRYYQEQNLTIRPVP